MSLLVATVTIQRYECTNCGKIYEDVASAKACCVCSNCNLGPLAPAKGSLVAPTRCSLCEARHQFQLSHDDVASCIRTKTAARDRYKRDIALANRRLKAARESTVRWANTIKKIVRRERELKASVRRAGKRKL